MNISWTWVIAVIALCFGVVYFADTTIDARKERDGYKTQLEAEQVRTKRLQRDVQSATAKANAARLAHKEALDAYPEYRDAPVPVPIRDSLCGTLRCKPASPVPAP